MTEAGGGMTDCRWRGAALPPRASPAHCVRAPFVGDERGRGGGGVSGIPLTHLR